MLVGAQPRPARAAAPNDGPDAPDRGTVGELWLYGVVGGWWRGFDAESVARALRELGSIDTLYVRIHSPGGSAAEGVAIANLLRNLSAHVVTVVDGYACSSASVIAVAGDEVVMCPGAQLMLHDASTGMYVWGDEEELRAQIAELQQVADWIGGQSQNFAGVYAYKAGGTPESWRQVMTQNGQLGRWYTGEEAVAAKLADRVGTIAAISSPPVAPDDDFDEEDDEVLARLAHDLALLDQDVHPAARAAWQGERLKPPSASAVGSTHTEGGSAVSLSDQAVPTLRTKLGIAEDADEATILAALDEALDERAEPAPATATAAVTPGDVVIPEVRLKDLETAAATGVAAAKELHAMKRDAFLDAHKSKSPATSRADWAKRYDKDPEGTRELLSAAADLIPTEDLGHGDGPDSADAPTTLAQVRENPNYQNWVI